MAQGAQCARTILPSFLISFRSILQPTCEFRLNSTGKLFSVLHTYLINIVFHDSLILMKLWRGLPWWIKYMDNKGTQIKEIKISVSIWFRGVIVSEGKYKRKMIFPQVFCVRSFVNFKSFYRFPIRTIGRGIFTGEG